jgi:hypothetical protein
MFGRLPIKGNTPDGSTLAQMAAVIGRRTFGLSVNEIGQLRALLED